MFPRLNITTPLPSFAYSPHQYGAGVGFGAISPTVPYLASPYLSSPAPIPYSAPWASPYTSSPSPFAYPAIGTSPYAAQPGLPYPPAIAAAGASPISPISPWHSPFGWSPYALAAASQAYPAIHPALSGIAPSAFSSPATCIDPLTGALVPHPYTHSYPAAQGLLPIRPLIAAQPDPLQIAAMCGAIAPTMVDPYSVMAQMSPMSVSPIAPLVSPVSPAMRSPLFMSPVGSPPVSVPYTVTAGIPC
jgi:hypothetical protein